MFWYFMKNILALVFCLAISSCCFSQTICLMTIGNFLKGGAQGGQNIDFNDSAWRKIDLPHDWSIEDLSSTQSPRWIKTGRS